MDKHETLEVTTNREGEATFSTSTALRRLALRIIDATEETHQPSFELHDSDNFLKEGQVHIETLERSVSDVQF